MSRPLILASGSPRRKQLLSQLGLTFDVRVSDIDETPFNAESPVDYVERLSREKAASISSQVDRETIVLAADTTVVLEGNILGKPESKEHGVNMLMALSDTSHLVLTGVSVTGGNRFCTLTVETEVKFRKLTRREVLWYWDTGEPQDKAGSYGLQGIGAAFVESLSGSYSNVIGLPLSETIDLLRGFGVACLGQEEFEVDVRQSNG
ncbi:MAG: septum formation inhibitor Maf [Pseudomonadales bacterium]|jgi:septum formation protein|nr:septum formation inhibitor Maf [Pseudomonadales bacterium]